VAPNITNAAKTMAHPETSNSKPVSRIERNWLQHNRLAKVVAGEGCAIFGIPAIEIIYFLLASKSCKNWIFARTSWPRTRRLGLFQLRSLVHTEKTKGS
jgi:hypothetical protein